MNHQYIVNYYLNEEFDNKLEKAFHWYEKAAKQGHAGVQYELATLYEG